MLTLPDRLGPSMYACGGRMRGSMKIVCSPARIIDPRRPAQGVMDIRNAGFENISMDFAMCCSGDELENGGKHGAEAHITRERREEGRRMPAITSISEEPSALAGHFRRMTEACAEKLSMPIARAPYLLRDTKREDLTGLLQEIHRESIRFCGNMECESIVIRPFVLGKSREETWEANRAYYLALLPAARENHVSILLENQCRSLGGHWVRGLCSDGEEAAAWVDRLNEEAGEERFGFCMDVGTCNLCGQDMYDFAATLGKRLKAVCLRDCNGSEESSSLPFTCVCHGQPLTDWLGLIRGLRRIAFDGILLLDLADTAASFSPLLRPQLLGLAKAVADYFRWQVGIEGMLNKYSSVVLFGAGNMCRNYMKCYGEKYPPLFACDNNASIWGSTFCGLEVRPPEALKDLPEGCGVFICNIFYREIEKQLREMGIEHIEFFNDEFMPSFYFDRLEGM